MLTINGKQYNEPTAGQLVLAKHAYERYGGTTDNLNHLGKPMPAWEELPALIHLAWVAAANPGFRAKVELTPAEEALAGIQKILDMPGFNKKKMDKARTQAAGYPMGIAMRQAVDRYYSTRNAPRNETEV